MNRRQAIVLIAAALPSGAFANESPATDLGKHLTAIYSAWRNAMVRGDVSAWQRLTAPHRQMEVRNRLLSEKRPFPASVFKLPAPPPTLDGLKLIHVSQRGATAKAAWFGKVDFGVGGEPSQNVIVLSFVNSGGGWRYDKADFVNLAALPEVRRELAAGDLSYVEETPEFQASGTVPPTPPAIGPIQYIAKVYVFCPGREVQVQINGISRHRFANSKEAEVVIGGAKDGANTVSYSIKGLEGGTGKEALTIRVYLMSEIEGTQPLKAFEYQVEEGGQLKPAGGGSFNVDPATAAKLVPARR